MKVLLIRPNSTKDKQDTYVTFPLGIGYIASVLKKEGHCINIIDLTLENVDYKNLSKRVKAINPDIIGISALSYEYSQVKKLSNVLKKDISRKIILGGHLASHNYDIVLNKTGVDICVLGEGELTAVDLVKNISDYKNVKGIAYKSSTGEISLTPPRELIKDLDSVPFPAYELFDMDRYSKMLMRDIYLPKKFLPKEKEYRKISMEVGRGCPFNCNFCSKMFKRIRRRSVQSVFNEMKYLKDNYNINVFGFQDELLFINKDYIADFCKKIEPLKVSWYGNARIDTISKEMIDLVVKNRCLLISYGVESGSEKILKSMNKKTKPEQIKKVLKMTMRAGMPINMGLILGYPGETEETVRNTVDMLKEVGYPGLSFRYITPYPGSHLYNWCLENKIIDDEEKYLESVGDGTGPYRFRINFTEFSDDELMDLAPKTIKKVFRNYIFYLLKHPHTLLKYLRHKDFMNPIYFVYSRWKNPTNYDKASRRKHK
jgi:radical SAM superfamily enzyme YgiQ (UPF0313 family)